MNQADRFAGLLGIAPESRQVNIEKLYLSTEKTPGAYWLQLFIATGIAHMGLTLDSTAVIIGAMLVSPLMIPIVQVGMGFAIGHLHLTMRATVRLLLSIVGVAALAALMTRLMPIHEVTAEISARTLPTFLDMVVALFCGLAASFTTARGSRDTVTAAAGTAIAIALVPPVCVIGFGLGQGDAEIAFGAGMLFTANLAAIILVSNLFFIFTGFRQLDFERLEGRIYTEQDRAKRMYRLSQAIWPHDSKHLLSLRLLLPFAFVASVSVPLYNALQKVARQIAVRNAAAAVMHDFETAHDVQRHRLTIEQDAVKLYVRVSGVPAHRTALEQKLRLALAPSIGEQLNVQVEVQPSITFLEQRFAKSSKRFDEQLAALERGEDCPPAPDLDAVRTQALIEATSEVLAEGLRARLDTAVTRALPELPDVHWLGWALELGSDGTWLRVEQLGGQPLSLDARATLLNGLRHSADISMRGVVIAHVPRVLIDASADDPAAVDLGGLPAGLRTVQRRGGLALRFTRPAPATASRAVAKVTAAIDALLPKGEDAWVQRDDGVRWRLEVLPPTGRPPRATPAAP